MHPLTRTAFALALATIIACLTGACSTPSQPDPSAPAMILRPTSDGITQLTCNTNAGRYKLVLYPDDALSSDFVSADLGVVQNGNSGPPLTILTVNHIDSPSISGFVSILEQPSNDSQIRLHDVPLDQIVIGQSATLPPRGYVAPTGPGKWHSSIASVTLCPLPATSR